MNIVGKLLTALRGGVQDAGERLADGQALVILEQEMREANAELQRAKDSLAEVMAQQKVAGQRAAEVSEKIAEYEGYAMQALDKGEEALAAEVAAKIAALEADRAGHLQVAGEYGRAVQGLQYSVGEMEGHLRRIRQQADTVKATERVQKAQEAVAERFGGSQSRLYSAMESLSRIKEKQMEQAMRMEAGAELAQMGGDAQLDEKLRAAGIGRRNPDAEAVLERLRAERKDS